MPDVKAIEEAIKALPPTDLVEFRRWFVEFDSAACDWQIESDAKSVSSTHFLPKPNRTTVRPLPASCEPHGKLEVLTLL